MNKIIKEMMHYTVQLMILLILVIVAVVLLFLLTMIGSVLITEFAPSVICIMAVIVLGIVFGWSASGLFEVYDSRKAARRKGNNAVMRNVVKYKRVDTVPQTYYVGKVHKNS